MWTRVAHASRYFTCTAAANLLRDRTAGSRRMPHRAAATTPRLASSMVQHCVIFSPALPYGAHNADMPAPSPSNGWHTIRCRYAYKHFLVRARYHWISRRLTSPDCCFSAAHHCTYNTSTSCTAARSPPSSNLVVSAALRCARAKPARFRVFRHARRVYRRPPLPLMPRHCALARANTPFAHRAHAPACSIAPRSTYAFSPWRRVPAVRTCLLLRTGGHGQFYRRHYCTHSAPPALTYAARTVSAPLLAVCISARGFVPLAPLAPHLPT